MKGKFNQRCPSELVGVFKCTGRTLVLVFPRLEQAGLQNLGQRLAGLDDFKDVAAAQRSPVTFEGPRGDDERLASLCFGEHMAHLAALGYDRCANGRGSLFSHVSQISAEVAIQLPQSLSSQTRSAPKKSTSAGCS